MLRGLDASSVQGAVPYDKLGDEYKFIILKAQQGNDGFDPWFERNMKAGFDAGLEVFAYCFTYPLPHLSPEEQAKLFVDRVHRFPQMQGRPVFLDNEWPEPGKGWAKWGCTAKQINDWFRRNAAEVQRLSGAPPRIYTYDWFWSTIAAGADVSWARAYGLWMAWYRKGWPKPGDAPKVPEPWTWAEFWQFDGNGGLKLPNGVDSDFCVFNGEECDLQAVARGEPPRVPPLDVFTPKGIQARLAELGFYDGGIDGIFGPKTKAAIRAFQHSRGLAVDGIVGPNTRAQLLL